MKLTNKAQQNASIVAEVITSCGLLVADQRRIVAAFIAGLLGVTTLQPLAFAGAPAVPASKPAAIKSFAITNRLVNSNSPYLREHAHNPVDWYPWGAEAFKKAKDENKPILLSIGYASCHWCHVMEKESFENSKVAAVMNSNFVNIKVDKEQLPDVDSVYQNAAQRMTGISGWPLTVFLTPDLQPIYIALYVEPAFFIPMLKSIANRWKREKKEVLAYAKTLSERAKSQSAVKAQSLAAKLDVVAGGAIKEILDLEDNQYGGLGVQRKYPMPTILELAMLCSRAKTNFDPTTKAKLQSAVQLTLDRMATGALQDQLGGGFFRYCVDRKWRQPHFEKLLVDNAMLAHLYITGYRFSGSTYWLDVARRTLDFALRDLKGADGGFFAALDADSEGSEGKYYYFHLSDLTKAGLGDDQSWAGTVFGIGSNARSPATLFVPYLPDLPGNLAKRFNMTPDNFQARFDRTCGLLYEYRKRRIPPALDDQVIAGYNGLMIRSLSEAYKTFADPRYLAAAQQTARFILTKLYVKNDLMRAYGDHHAVQQGTLADYAYVISGLIALSTIDPTGGWLESAQKLTNRMLVLFYNDATGRFRPASLGHLAPSVATAPTDDVAPSGPAAATLDLILLARLTGKGQFSAIANHLLRGYGKDYSGNFLQSSFIAAADLFNSDSADIVAALDQGQPLSMDFLRCIGSYYLPHLQVIVVDTLGPKSGSSKIQQLIVLRGQGNHIRRPSVYLCKDRTCQAPLFDLKQLQRALQLQSN